MFDDKKISIAPGAKVTGDVFIGNKNVEYRFIVNQISNPSDLLIALRNSGSVEELSKLMEQILSDPEIREKISESTKGAFYKSASEYLDKVLAELKSTGPDKISLTQLLTFLNEAEARKDRSAYNFIATHLLQIVRNEPGVDEFYIDVANNVLKYPDDEYFYSSARIIALCFLARQRFFIFNNLRINNYISFQSIRDNNGFYSKKEMQDLANDVFEKRLDYYKLILEALDLVPKAGNKELLSIVLFNFMFVHEMDAVFYHVFGLSEFDKINSEIIQWYTKLEESPDLFSVADLANNRATYHYLVQDFKNAQTFSSLARDLYLEQGSAYNAKIAHKTFNESTNEKYIEQDDETLLRDFTTEKLISYLRDHASRVLKMKGINLEQEPELKKQIERGLSNSDPSEVYKYCEHIVYGLDECPPIGEELQLAGMGVVIITCQKGLGQRIGFEKNTVFESFKHSVCQGCKFHKPQSDDWSYTPYHDFKIHKAGKGN